MVSDNTFLYYKNFDFAHTRRISYIVFTKNRGTRLDNTIADLKRFMPENDELIVADGASTDSTQEVVLRHRDAVHIFLSELDRSAQHGVNKAILLARGKYIVLLPDDDRVHADGINASVKVMEKNPDIDLLVCGGIKHFLMRNISRPFYYGPGMNYGSIVDHAFTYGTCGNGFVIKRSTFAKVGLFPADAVEWDVIWFAQCIANGGITKFARINLFDHYITEDSISYNVRQKMISERIRFMKQYCSPAFVRAYRRKKNVFYRALSINRAIDIVHLAKKIIYKEGSGKLVRLIMGRSRSTHNKKTRVHSLPVWDNGFS